MTWNHFIRYKLTCTDLGSLLISLRVVSSMKWACSGLDFLSPLMEFGFSPTYTRLSLCWETEMSYGQLVVQWEARWEEGEGWWKDELVKTFCSLYCVQAQWQTAPNRVLSAAYCASFSVNLGQLCTFALQQTLWDERYACLSPPRVPCSLCYHAIFFFSYPVSIFHSVCPFHLHTDFSWESMLHPCPPPNVIKLTLQWNPISTD